MEVMDKEANDFEFISATVVAIAGNNLDSRNVRIYDTLLPEESNLVQTFKCHPGGAHSVTYLPSTNVLITGGLRGSLCAFDLTKMVCVFKVDPSKSGHRITRLRYDPWAHEFLTGSSDGKIQVWDADHYKVVTEFPGIYSKNTFFHHPAAFGMMTSFGVTDISVSGQHVFVCGSDGSVKYIRKRHRIV